MTVNTNKTTTRRKFSERRQTRTAFDQFSELTDSHQLFSLTSLAFQHSDRSVEQPNVSGKMRKAFFDESFNYWRLKQIANTQENSFSTRPWENRSLFFLVHAYKCIRSRNAAFSNQNIPRAIENSHINFFIKFHNFELSQFSGRGLIHVPSKTL